MPKVSLMYACILLLPGMTGAFHGGWTSRVGARLFSTRPPQHTTTCRKRHDYEASGSCSTSRRTRGVLRLLRASPNEYDTFFNNASKSGQAVIKTLDPEERARRAMEGEKLEDDIMEIATVLREKADEMVTNTGSIDFAIIQPMIDEIQVLKGKYRLVVGANVAEDAESPVERTDEDEASS